jgi:CDP-diacylglycerol---glycerol-3-phosphate 3-phosphatidyltransferase
LLVSASRYLFAGGLWLLKHQGRPVYNLTDSERRRGMAGFQMGLNVAVLLPLLVPPVTSLAASLFMIPFLAGFLRDWLVVSGAVDPQSRAYRALMLKGEQLFYGWLPIVFRAGAGGFFTYFILTEASASSEHRIIVILMIGQVVLAVMILAGILGRLSALGLLAAAGLAFSGAHSGLPDIALSVSLILVLLFGTGYFSLWQPEEAFLRYHAGVKS